MSHPATDTARDVTPPTPGSRKSRARAARAFRLTLAAGERAPAMLSDNPNRGKRHAARLTDAMPAMAARIEIERRRPNYSGADRVPTTYRTIPAGTRRVRDESGRLVPFETRGYTV